MPLKWEVVAPGGDDRQQGHHLQLLSLATVASFNWGQDSGERVTANSPAAEREG